MIATFRRTWIVTAGLALASLALEVGCGGGPSASEDERGSVGVPPTGGEYCRRLGYPVVDSLCQLPDGTTCDAWDFYRGKCGQAHTYCNRHGGSIALVTEDAGTWTAEYGECTVDGGQCEEGSFVATGTCP